MQMASLQRDPRVFQIPLSKEPLPMVESELTAEKQQNWDAHSKEVLGILLRGGASRSCAVKESPFPPRPALPEPS